MERELRQRSFELNSHAIAVNTLNARPRARGSCHDGGYIVDDGAAEDREGRHRKVYDQGGLVRTYVDHRLRREP
jgi:hypothetical protein